MKLFKILVLLLSITALAACGGGSGSSSDAAKSDVVVKTQIDFGTAAITNSQGYVTTKATTAIVVTLTMEDGTSYQMTDNGNGDYSCTVSNYSSGAAGYIEAHAGDVVLKNFFDGLTDDNGEADIGATDPDTTLFVDVLSTFAAALTENENIVTASKLLEMYSNAALDIDVVELKEQVANEGTYESLRHTYNAQLTWEKAESGEGVSAALASALTESTVYKEIHTGGITPPPGATTNDIKAVITTIYSAYATGDVSELAKAIDSSKFLMDGYDTEHWLADIEEEIIEAEEEGLTREVVTLDVSGTKIDSTNQYKVFIVTHERIKNANGDIIEEYRDNDHASNSYKASPTLVENNGGTWTLIGNQKKSETWLSMNFHKNGSSDVSKSFWAEVTATESYPVSAVTMTSDAFSGTKTLTVQDTDDNDEYILSMTTGDDLLISDLCNNESFVFNVEYTDGTNEVTTIKLPSCPTSAEIEANTPEINDIVVNSDNSLTVSFDKGALSDKLSWLYLEVLDSNGYDIEEEDDIPFEATSVKIEADDLINNNIYTIRLTASDTAGRSFSTETTYPYNME
ncbi:hypothetical protein Dacet_1644 [Denitrovibrio acetiphilus DSM 12809]|uniref:Fibronectin type-III domain-containing protein n=1 Tax=Denitrovibrio acetiphilus (strain DSM 12809 / NBRC 114555 / N2460) TaxID=522772 RepID=D4H8R0_DENA2|nr:hypothetical protein [Denitrovibrio acetiphilus]ADD68409.1 hypothetical protein Dacet_1644 [Denitrovibrio acetiphilus DSM 12809]